MTVIKICFHPNIPKLASKVEFEPPHSFTGANRRCAALTVFTLSAAAVCTAHLSHNRSDSSSI